MPRSPIRSKPATVRAGRAAFTALDDAFSRLYGIAQHSTHVFGSPLGPVTIAGETYTLPRFVYFGPQFSDESVRLVFHAGFDGRDPRPTRALLHVVERLALKPDVGQGLNLTFFPLVNPSGLARRTTRSAAGVDLAAAHWNLSSAPEIGLLAHDARLRGYHGFVRVVSASVDEMVATVRNSSAAAIGTDTVLTVVPEVAGLRVHWITEPGQYRAAAGPLTLADDLPLAPFELTVQVPDSWSADLYREAVLQVLKTFIIHYRATYAYGIHL